MMRTEPTPVFIVHRWKNHETTSDYPYLAVTEDRGTLLSLGNSSVTFEWEILEDAARYLASDFEPTGERFELDLLPVRYLLDATFSGGVEFGIVHYDDNLSITGFQLTLRSPRNNTAALEYVIEGFGSYLRLYRDEDQYFPVSLPERSMLDGCISTFAELAAQHAAFITAPPPPRYR